jgi:hypothetical protein
LLTLWQVADLVEELMSILTLKQREYEALLATLNKKRFIEYHAEELMSVADGR